MQCFDDTIVSANILVFSKPQAAVTPDQQFHHWYGNMTHLAETKRLFKKTYILFFFQLWFRLWT